MKISGFEQKHPSKTIIAKLLKSKPKFVFRQISSIPQNCQDTHRKEAVELLCKFRRVMKDQSSTRDWQEDTFNFRKNGTAMIASHERGRNLFRSIIQEAWHTRKNEASAAGTTALISGPGDFRQMHFIVKQILMKCLNLRMSTIFYFDQEYFIIPGSKGALSDLFIPFPFRDINHEI